MTSSEDRLSIEGGDWWRQEKASVIAPHLGPMDVGYAAPPTSHSKRVYNSAVTAPDGKAGRCHDAYPPEEGFARPSISQTLLLYREIPRHFPSQNRRG